MWPITSNTDYLDALEKANDGESPNNISPIIKYSLDNGVTILWFGDLENTFTEKVQDIITLPSADIIFAPHHGRDSGKLPKKWLNQINPKVVIIGEASSENLNYYPNYNTITQNSAGDITFECVTNKVHMYVSNDTYTVDFLNNEKKSNTYGNYLGTLDV